MRISVVIPVYNEQAVLGECLNALAVQTRPPDEIVIVDNNCSDQSIAIAARYQRVRIITQPRQGIMPSTFAGLQASRGDLIARCDADSLVPSSWLADIEQTFTAVPSLDALTGPGSFYGCSRMTAAVADIIYMKAYFVLTRAALAHPPLFGSNFVIRRQKWTAISAAVHGSRTDIHDDMEISLHLDPSDSVRYDPHLRVGISARALRLRGMNRRLTMGLRTLRLHWPEQAPWQRWRRRLHTLR